MRCGWNCRFLLRSVAPELSSCTQSWGWPPILLDVYHTRGCPMSPNDDIFAPPTPSSRASLLSRLKVWDIRQVLLLLAWVALLAIFLCLILWQNANHAELEQKLADI